MGSAFGRDHPGHINRRRCVAAAPAPVDVAGMIAAEREARPEAILPGSTALPATEEKAEP